MIRILFALALFLVGALVSIAYQNVIDEQTHGVMDGEL